MSRQLKYVDPLRNPRFASEEVRNRRGWVLLLTSALIPGSVQTMLGNRKMGRFALRVTLITWALLLVVLVLAIVRKQWLISLATSSFVLIPLMAFAVLLGVVWVLCLLDTVRLIRVASLGKRTRPVFLSAALVSVLVVGGAFTYGVTTLNSGRQLLDNIFNSRKVEKAVDGRYNIALLGSDAGKGRTGVRPDSLSVVSIDAKTGAAVSIGLPRNMQNVPFPKGSPLAKEYPNGYNCGDDCLLNAVYQLGEDNASLFPDDGPPAGVQATKQAMEGVTGLKIQYYAMIDLKGFEQLIDAMGGIKLTSHVRVPISSKTNKRTGKHGPPKGWIEPGENIHLDGYHALWYARSREFASDYERMTRQRCVQEAMLTQLDPATVLSRFQKIAGAAPNVVSTDVPRSQLDYFVDLAQKTRDHKLGKLNLSPPRVKPSHPDFDKAHSLVQEAIKKSEENAQKDKQGLGAPADVSYYAMGADTLAAPESNDDDAKDKEICEVK